MILNKKYYLIEGAPGSYITQKNMFVGAYGDFTKKFGSRQEANTYRTQELDYPDDARVICVQVTVQKVEE